jgi:hypothetical protein
MSVVGAAEFCDKYIDETDRLFDTATIANFDVNN